MDLEFLLVCLTALSLAAGLVIGRWRALAVAVALTALLYLGIDRDWWGGGLADGWIERGLLPEGGVALVAAAVGVAAHKLVRRRRDIPAAARAAVAALCLIGLGGYLYASTRPPDLRALRDSPRTLYYLGDSFEGRRMTHAVAGRRGGYVAYGDCDIDVGRTEGGCVVPLAVENVTCPGVPTAVALWGGKGSGDGLLVRASRALRAVDSARRAPRPRVSFNVNAFGHCFPPMQGFEPQD